MLVVPSGSSSCLRLVVLSDSQKALGDQFGCLTGWNSVCIFLESDFRPVCCLRDCAQNFSDAKIGV